MTTSASVLVQKSPEDEQQKVLEKLKKAIAESFEFHLAALRWYARLIYLEGQTISGANMKIMRHHNREFLVAAKELEALKVLMVAEAVKQVFRGRLRLVQGQCQCYTCEDRRRTREARAARV